MDIMQPRKIDGEGIYFNSCHPTSEILNNRQATFDNKQPKPHPCTVRSESLSHSQLQPATFAKTNNVLEL